jgi:hypothetical protein
MRTKRYESAQRTRLWQKHESVEDGKRVVDQPTHQTGVKQVAHYDDGVVITTYYEDQSRKNIQTVLIQYPDDVEKKTSQRRKKSCK